MQFIIFGAGENASKLIGSMVKNGYEIKFLVDNDKEKQGKQILGFDVKSPKELINFRKGQEYVLISVLNKLVYEEIAAQMVDLGLKRDGDFSHGKYFFSTDVVQSGKVSGYIDLPEKFSAIKSFDPASHLIKLKKERRIFRLVHSNFAEQYVRVHEICRDNHLYGSYVIETKIVENIWNLSEGLVLEHCFLEPVSYSFEWSPGMFSDYVSFMLSMLKRFAECGLALCDGHTLNATITEGRFIFIDFGALKEGNTSGIVLLEFLNTHIIPLILIYKNQIAKAYLYLKNPGIEYTITDIQGYLNEDELSTMQMLYRSLIQINSAEDICRFVEMVSEFIGSMNRNKLTTRWEGYQNDEWEWSSDPSKWSLKMRNVSEMIERINPDTIVDLAGNMGWYGTYWHKNLKYALIVDYDYNCIDYLWKKICINKMSNVVPIYMSVCVPTLDYYRDDAISGSAVEPWRKSAVDRFRSEVVIALAIVHHLAFAQQLSFAEIIGQFTLFTSRYLIVEFIEQNDQYITNFLKNGFEWYTKENFVRELKKNFKILETRLSTPCETRTIYLCELK